MGILLASCITVPIQELFGSVVWWYGAGLKGMGHWLVTQWHEVEAHIHWKQWAGALFVPMYGQNDWKGRLISLLMRLVVLLYKTVWVVVWVLFHIIILITYGIFPIVAATMSAACILAFFP